MIEAPSKPRVDPKEYRKPMLVTEEVRSSYLYPRFPYTYYSLCPRCRTTFERDYIKFCNNCGQRLKWPISVRKKTE